MTGAEGHVTGAEACDRSGGSAGHRGSSAEVGRPMRACGGTGSRAWGVRGSEGFGRLSRELPGRTGKVAGTVALSWYSRAPMREVGDVHA